MKWQNKQFPFFAYRDRSKSIFIMTKLRNIDLIETDYKISVNPNLPFFEVRTSQSSYFTADDMSSSGMQEISVLSQEQKRTAFISILDNYKVWN